MHQITLFRDKKFKNFLGRGQPHTQTPNPSGEGTPSPGPTLLGTYGISTPPFKNHRSATAHMPVVTGVE